jgi:hypothetical protein
MSGPLFPYKRTSPRFSVELPLIAGMFPDRILATPHEGWSVRSWRMRDIVLAQREICLIKEGWLEEFPNEIK